MGTKVSVDQVPIEWNQLDSLLDSTPDKRDHGFLNNLKAWKIHCTEDDGQVTCKAVNFTSSEQFKPDHCYVLAHTYPKLAFSEKQGRALGLEHAGVMTFASSMEYLTPRGLEQAFSSDIAAKNNPQRQSSSTSTCWNPSPQQDDGYSVYVWNGKQANSYTKASTLVRGFELEKMFRDNPHLPSLLFQAGSPVPITECWKDDTNSNSALMSGTGQTPAPPPLAPAADMYRRNHLFRRLSSPPGSPRLQVSSLTTTTSLSCLLGLSPRSPRSSPRSHLSTSPPSHTHPTSTSTAASSQATNNHHNTSTTQHSTWASPSTRKPTTLATPPLGIPSLNTTQAAAPSTRPPVVPSLSFGSKTKQDAQQPLIQSPTSPHSPMVRPVGKLSLGLGSLPMPSSPSEKEKKLLKWTKIPSQVEDHLFVGSEMPSRDKKLLKSHGITHIVNTAAMILPCQYPDDFVYECVNLMDTPEEDISPFFPLLIQFIERVRENKGKVYVHCYQGVSRSCTIVIAYLMWKYHLTFEEAFDKLRLKRPICSPNAGFIASLFRWYKQLSMSRQSQLFRLTPPNAQFPIPFILKEAARGGGTTTPRPSSSSDADGAPLNTPRSGGTSSVIPNTPTSTNFLDPRTCYLLLTPTHAFTWKGRECPSGGSDELDALTPAIQRYFYGDRVGGCGQGKPLTPTPLEQGSEPAEFWTHLRNICPGIQVTPNPDYDDLYGSSVFPDFLQLQKQYQAAAPNQRPEFHNPGEHGIYFTTQPSGEKRKRRDGNSDEDGEMPSSSRQRSESSGEDDTSRSGSARDGGPPEMYTFPKMELLELFDPDDLDDDGVFLVTQYLPSANQADVWVWFGMRADIENQQDYANKAAEEWRKHKGFGEDVMLNITVQESENELDSFWDLFH
eukprot:TRINITY_DN62988_c0_g1_i1.p1 TRINITY_DN62988_c0_g1~~TRINITY_DN62988_c0_g1_i1.p1  ORF type:complete len:892 (-),score=56.52 TRINITY_DN62988_c0_g1_i1:64-2739(-)